MKILEKYKFIKNRFSQIPKKILLNAKKMSISIGELDLVLKLLNFNHFSEITPQLTNLSNQTGISTRTYQRNLSSLKDKKFLSVEQKKDEKGKFTSNSYDLDGFYNSLEKIESKQLSMDFESSGVKSSSLGGFIISPRALDFFQKDLNLDQKEVVLLKYLFCYIDDSGISEISLNYITKISPFSRSTLTNTIKSLEDKKLLVVKEQFIGLGRTRTRNRYDLTPLFSTLEKLEKSKVKSILEGQGKWKDFSKNRKKGEIKSTSKEKYKNNTDRILFLENEISRLQKGLTSKYSNEAELIREYQVELSDLKYNNSSKNLISNLLLDRLSMYKKLKNTSSWKAKYTKEQYRKAMFICNKLNGNWDKNSNFYLKAVDLCETTIDRYTALSENAKSKERYFLVMVSKVFKKLERKEIGV